MSALAKLFSGGRDGGPRRKAGEAVVASSASPVTLTLPTPPSVNNCFRNLPGKGRVKSADYIDWIGHAGWTLREQKPGRVGGYVVVSIAVERESATADLDNRIKAILDLIVKHDVIDDDRFVVGLCAAWSPPSSKLCRVMILPAASYDFQFQLASEGAHGGWFISAPQPEPETA